MRKVETVRRVYHEGGASSLIQTVDDYARSQLYQLGVLSHKPYQQFRTDNEHRWELMKPKLQADDSSVLDIGCAEGVLTAKFANKGLFSLGIDISEPRINSAKELFDDENRAVFTEFEISPETIDHLPTFDVVLMLTVYHHWCNNFGMDAAEDMLLSIAADSRIIFFEPPGQDWNHFDDHFGSLVEDGQSVSEAHAAYLESVLGEGTEITFLGETEYKQQNDRTDPLFAIDCTEY